MLIKSTQASGNILQVLNEQEGILWPSFSCSLYPQKQKQQQKYSKAKMCKV